MILIGLTGGIASGKSTVSQMFADLGAAVIDADKVGHEVLKPNTDTWDKLVAAFGRGILNSAGEIERPKLADIVFNDPESLKKLNAITHPAILKIINDRVEEYRRNGARAVIVEAAVLIEAKWTDMVDQVWVTIAPEATVIKRLCNNKGYTEEQAKARIKSQLPIDQRARYANVLINTDRDLGAIRAEVGQIWRKLLAETSPGSNRDCKS